VRCPRCGNRALGLVGWFVHSLYQPVWKKNRYRLNCRSCDATLAPSARDRILAWALPLSAIAISLGVASELPPGYRPYYMVQLLIGFAIGILVHYPMARYDCLDAVPLPRAQADNK
jgi:hypothetical protein